MGPSLGLWRAAEIAALREQTYEPPVLDLGCGDRAGPEPGGARALRPGGRLILTAPTEAFSRQLALSFARYAAWRNRRLAHLNLWPVAEWTRRLERAGLEALTVRPYLRPALVWSWDALELLQQPRIRGRQLFSRGWRRLSPAALDRLAERAARLDLSSPPPGGGRLTVARKL